MYKHFIASLYNPVYQFINVYTGNFSLLLSLKNEIAILPERFSDEIPI